MTMKSSNRQRYCYGRERRELAGRIKKIRSWNRASSFDDFAEWAIDLERRMARIEFYDKITSSSIEQLSYR